MTGAESGVERVTRDKLQQTYANFFSITASEEEVLLEFGMRKVENPKEVEMLQRIIVGPPFAHRIMKVLDGVVSRLPGGEAAIAKKEGGAG